MDLEKIRSAIDTIDYEIVKLLSRRLEHALRLKRLKGTIVEPERERQVIEHVRGCSHTVAGAGIHRAPLQDDYRGEHTHPEEGPAADRVSGGARGLQRSGSPRV